MTTRAELERTLLSAGQQLSNVAYNWKSREGYALTKYDIETLTGLFKLWDAARDALKEFDRTNPTDPAAALARKDRLLMRAREMLATVAPLLAELQRYLDEEAKGATGG